MILSNVTPLQKTLAIKAFQASFKEATDILKIAEAAYLEAKQTCEALSALIQSFGEEGIDTVEAPPARKETTPTDEQAVTQTKALTAPEATKTKVVRRFKLRKVLVRLITETNKVQSTGDIMILVRQAVGSEVPPSTITGGLSALFNNGDLKRIRPAGEGTSIYGLPEWFDENGKPKPEYQYRQNDRINTNATSTEPTLAL